MSETPVLIGLSSFQEKGSFDDLNEALHLMDHAAKEAIDDCGNPEIINYIDEIRVPKGFWKYRDPGRWIALNNSINSSAKTYVTKNLEHKLNKKSLMKLPFWKIRQSIKKPMMFCILMRSLIILEEWQLDIMQLLKPQ